MLATAFGCPFTGPVPAADVQRAAEAVLESGIVGIALADTIGTAVPTEVAAQVAAVRSIAGDVPVGVHLHDTRGLALANALTAIDAGAVRVDAAVGGLGGCPFAPGRRATSPPRTWCTPSRRWASTPASTSTSSSPRPGSPAIW